MRERRSQLVTWRQFAMVALDPFARGTCAGQGDVSSDDSFELVEKNSLSAISSQSGKESSEGGSRRGGGLLTCAVSNGPGS